MSEAQEAAARGAMWLDERKPDWYRDIDVGALDLSDSCRCVFGQMFGTYGNAYETEFAVMKYPGWSADYGFFLPFNGNGSWEDLDEAWIAEIKHRWEHDTTTHHTAAPLIGEARDSGG